MAGGGVAPWPPPAPAPPAQPAAAQQAAGEGGDGDTRQDPRHLQPPPHSEVSLLLLCSIVRLTLTILVIVSNYAPGEVGLQFYLH